jgi:hypothetical protein
MSNFSQHYDKQTTVSLSAADWSVIQALARREFKSQPKRFPFRFTASNLAHMEVIAGIIRSKTPGVRITATLVVREALSWYLESTRVPYYISVSQLIRDAMSFYVLDLSPRQLREVEKELD